LASRTAILPSERNSCRSFSLLSATPLFVVTLLWWSCQLSVVSWRWADSLWAEWRETDVKGCRVARALLLLFGATNKKSCHKYATADLLLISRIGELLKLLTLRPD